MINAVTNQLVAAISHMRDALDHAERIAQSGDMDAVQGVLHETAWAYANAMTRIESALSAVRMQHIKEIHNLKTGSA